MMSANRGTLLSNYKLGRVLGEGGYSIVKLGTNLSNGKIVAVKIEDKTGMSVGEKKQLMHEVNMMKRLDHPHIVKLVDFFDEPSSFYVIMEYIDGGELFDRIVQKQFYSEKEARDAVRVVLTTLKYCHDQGIVHR
jgi:serine/threonine protein kinase